VWWYLGVFVLYKTLNKTIKIHRIVEGYMQKSMSELFPSIAPEKYSAKNLVDYNGEPYIGSDNMAQNLYGQGFLIEHPDGLVLVDTAFGTVNPVSSIRYQALTDEIVNLGFSLNDVKYVINTHIHTDHTGWNVELVNNALQVTFPNATYLLNARELDGFAGSQESKDSVDWKDRIQVLLDSKKVMMLLDEYEILDGIEAEPCFGHTSGHMCVMVRNALPDRAVFLIGDTFHQTFQIQRPNWPIIWDMDPTQAAGLRERIVEAFTGFDNVVWASHWQYPGTILKNDKGEAILKPLQDICVTKADSFAVEE